MRSLLAAISALLLMSVWCIRCAPPSPFPSETATQLEVQRRGKKSEIKDLDQLMDYHRVAGTTHSHMEDLLNTKKAELERINTQLTEVCNGCKDPAAVREAAEKLASRFSYHRDPNLNSEIAKSYKIADEQRAGKRERHVYSRHG
jgi:hypothetical protein